MIFLDCNTCDDRLTSVTRVRPQPCSLVCSECMLLTAPMPGTCVSQVLSDWTPALQVANKNQFTVAQALTAVVTGGTAGGVTSNRIDQNECASYNICPSTYGPMIRRLIH